MRAFRLLFAVAIAAMGIGLAHGVSLAANGGTDHFGPFQAPNPDLDNGTCGPWANDVFTRSFDVHNNGDGTFTMKEWFRDGTFTTLGGASPGCAETDKHHGTYVNPGIQGTFQGFEVLTITATGYNPNGCAIATSCNTTDGFVASVFSGVSGEACPSDNSTCFNFEYSSSDKTLQYRHWSDTGTGSNEVFNGDIANF